MACALVMTVVKAVVPQKVIERLLGKLSVPEVKEATHVEWIALP